MLRVKDIPYNLDKNFGVYYGSNSVVRETTKLYGENYLVQTQSKKIPYLVSYDPMSARAKAQYLSKEGMQKVIDYIFQNKVLPVNPSKDCVDYCLTSSFINFGFPNIESAVNFANFLTEISKNHLVDQDYQNIESSYQDSPTAKINDLMIQRHREITSVKAA